jgi:hypothetical protein
MFLDRRDTYNAICTFTYEAVQFSFQLRTCSLFPLPVWVRLVSLYVIFKQPRADAECVTIIIAVRYR